MKNLTLTEDQLLVITNAASDRVTMILKPDSLFSKNKEEWEGCYGIPFPSCNVILVRSFMEKFSQSKS
jgi:hypothetical protein